MIKELKTYMLVIGPSVEQKGNTDVTVKNDLYQVVNKDTGVVEVETRILPQALEYLQQLQAALDNAMSPQPKEPVNVTPIVKPSGTKYNH